MKEGLVGRVSTPPLARIAPRAMDLRLRELTWVRLVTLLVWTLLVMIKRGITQLIEAIEGRIFVRSEPVVIAGRQGEELRRTLLPPLDDELVLRQIWPLLHKRVNVSLLWRMRRVSRAWRERVGTTVEWAALEVVRVDAPGYLRYLAEHGERRPSLQERVETELEALTRLLSEHLWDFTNRPGTGQSRGERREGLCDASSEIESRKSVRRRRRMYERSRTRARREVNWSEEEKIEADMSSTDRSMRVYYPRHRIR
jgi:hypothetical protein